MRYFRAASVEVYESVRAELDAVWGYPNPDTKTRTAITPASEAPTDAAGRVYLIASPAECEYPAIAERLPAMLASGMVAEVTAAEFADQFPSPA
jgi:tRNA A37 N6-isopentenylltransferase MiaA